MKERRYFSVTVISELDGAKFHVRLLAHARNSFGGVLVGMKSIIIGSFSLIFSWTFFIHKQGPLHLVSALEEGGHVLGGSGTVANGVGSSLGFTAIALPNIQDVRTHWTRSVYTVGLCADCCIGRIAHLPNWLLLMHRQVFVRIGKVRVIGHTRRRVVRKRHAIMSVICWRKRFCVSNP